MTRRPGPPAAVGSGRGELIVIVEDHVLHARMLRLALSKCLPSCVTELYTEGLAAARRLADRAAPLPDLLVLDLDVPGRSGHQLLADRAASPRLRSVPAAVVTSSEKEADRTRALALGADEYLHKPRDQVGFMALAERLVRLLRAGRGAHAGDRG
jgi:CheY-like chemotaxis protein